MRAVCEKCGTAAPPDWKAGDLCSACGAAVRRDVRCFWCAKWTPFARFCRSCGAELVEEPLYGAARMLKDAGTDRFTVPRMLRELDREQVENFTRIYQRHAIAVARHVDELRFLERFLFHRGFSAALESALVPELPWPEEKLERLSAPPPAPGDDLATVKAIGAATPFAATRAVAALARLRLGDLEAHREAVAALRDSDPALRAEAALALTGWRVLATVGRPRGVEREVLEELRRSPFEAEAAVRLAALGERHEDRLRDALASPDPELAFPAAVALGEVDRLRAALQGDQLTRTVAGNELIALGVIQPVVEVIEKSPAEVQRELVESAMRREEPLPELGETLLEIVETTEDDTLRERAARVLCRALRPEWAMRIARAAKGERYVFQSLLSERAALPPETLAELAGWMVESGCFAMHQYGLAEAGERGAIPDGFVPAVFARAAGEEARGELLRFAEQQLGARGDETLHRFVMGVVFGDFSAKTRAAAWWALHRYYRGGGDQRGEGPLRIEVASLERFFGSVRAFIPRLTAVVRDEASLREVGLYDRLAPLFASADPAAMPAFFAEEALTHELLRALLGAARADLWPQLVSGMIQFVGLAGTHPRWRREAIAGLEALGKAGDYHWEKALARLREPAP